MKFEAFVSYRHGGLDEKVAAQVQKEIEKYHVPAKIAAKTGRKRVGRVFRDSEELQASSDLSAVIRDSLDESEWLIAIVSERYNESPWCMEEIEYFIRLRGREKVIVILISGEPNDVFPKVLTEVEKDGKLVHIEPLAVDIRAESEGASLKKLKIERFRFFSSLLGVGYDDLRNRQRERRMKRMVAILGSALIIFVSVLGVITMKNIQLNETYDALEQSNQETLRGESYYLAEYADEAYKEGDKQTAIKLALKALPTDLDNPERPYVTDALRSLTQATGIYDYTAGYHAYFSKNSEEEAFDARTQLSPDGGYVLIEKYVENVDQLDRYVSVVRISDAAEVFSSKETPINLNSCSAQTTGATFSFDGEKLYYLGDEGLTCLDIASGKEIFTAENAVDMRQNPNATKDHTAIVTIDYAKGMLYGYDHDGKKTLDVELGNDLNYELGQIDQKGGQVILAANTEQTYGVVTIDLSSGEYAVYEMEGPCSNVQYSGENRICFLMTDLEDGLKHIVQYEIETGAQRYLCNTKFDVSDVILGKGETCYYYQDNTIYEVDCNDEKGKNIWKHSFTSQITTLKTGDGLVSVSCRDGSVYVYDEADKRSISTPDGSGEPVYVESVSKNILTTRDYWGRSVRVYKKNNADDHSGVTHADISEVTGGVIPSYWNTAFTDCDRFLLGLYYDNSQKLAVFDADTLEDVNAKKMNDMGITDGDNKSFSLSDNNNISLYDYDYYQFINLDVMRLTQSHRESLSDAMYLSSDGKTLYVSKDGKMRIIDVTGGKVTDETDIPTGFTSAINLNERIIYYNDNTIRIDSKDGSTEATIKDVSFEAVNEKRDLVIYRKTNNDSLFMYDAGKNQIVCEGKSGNNHSVQFFGNNRFVLVDYTSIYDMDSWKKALELKTENGNVYGAQTTEDLNYFVVWCRKESTESFGYETGVVYEKDGSGEPVAVIPNYVALAPDGEIITYDGEQTLYKFPLLEAAKIKKKAEEMVGNIDFTDRQKERYHLFG